MVKLRVNIDRTHLLTYTLDPDACFETLYFVVNEILKKRLTLPYANFILRCGTCILKSSDSCNSIGMETTQDRERVIETILVQVGRTAIRVVDYDGKYPQIFYRINNEETVDNLVTLYCSIRGIEKYKVKVMNNISMKETMLGVKTLSGGSILIRVSDEKLYVPTAMERLDQVLGDFSSLYGFDLPKNISEMIEQLNQVGNGSDSSLPGKAATVDPSGTFQRFGGEFEYVVAAEIPRCDQPLDTIQTDAVGSKNTIRPQNIPFDENIEPLTSPPLSEISTPEGNQNSTHTAPNYEPLLLTEGQKARNKIAAELRIGSRRPRATPFACFCGNTFTRHADIKAHREAEHSIFYNHKYHCGICEPNRAYGDHLIVAFTEYEAWESHLSKTHGVGKDNELFERAEKYAYASYYV